MTVHHRRARVATTPEPRHPRSEREARIMAMSALFSAVSYTHHELRATLRTEAHVLAAENTAYIAARLSPGLTDDWLLAIAHLEFGMVRLGYSRTEDAARIVAAAIRGYLARPAVASDDVLVAIDDERHRTGRYVATSVAMGLRRAA